MESTELARIHLDCAVKLVGRDVVTAWLAASLAPTQTTAPSVTSVAQSSTRGRKPGAAPEGVRCVWKFVNGDQCKNTRVTDSTACKIHCKKLHLIDVSGG
jgi:hypothetical protein